MTGPAVMDLFSDLEGRVAFVTGASSGLGRHFAHTLARAGMRVAVGARRRDALATLCAELAEAGAESVAVALDVADSASIAAAVDTVESRFGPIRTLVNNAGISHSASVLDHTEQDWDRVLDTNLRGAFLVAQSVAQRLRDSGLTGSIINIASVLGVRQGGQVAAYATSKAGLIQLTKTMALELARFGIRVNALAPGYVETDINREFRGTPAAAALVKRIPQRRFGTPADLDGALLLLASDASAYMTGAVLPVDGGHLVSTL
jgi:NAD(P)-dependent dehydrogenase (short-subunit alcohol dehydrogenase family)